MDQIKLFDWHYRPNSCVHLDFADDIALLRNFPA